MDNLLAKHITNEVTEMVMAENKRLQQENEDLKMTNWELLKDARMCEILSARVNTLEKEYSKYYDRCVDLERVNDMLTNSLGVPQPQNLNSNESSYPCYNVVQNSITSSGVPLPQGMIWPPHIEDQGN